jgi:DNA-binding MarR family transcriptional regulator
MKIPPRPDHVDDVRRQWKQQRPDLDTSPISVIARVGRLGRFFDVGIDRVLAEHDLRRESWDVLAALRRSGPPYRLSPTQLYRGLMRASGTISNRLRALERDGLIRRIGDDSDGRAVLVEITGTGRELVDRIAPLHLDNERAMLSALTPDEQEQLASLLRKLLHSFES